MGDVTFRFVTGSADDVIKVLRELEIEGNQLHADLLNAKLKAGTAKPEAPKVSTPKIKVPRVQKVSAWLRKLLSAIERLSNGTSCYKRCILTSVALTDHKWGKLRKSALAKGYIAQHGTRGLATYSLTDKGRDVLKANTV